MESEQKKTKTKRFVNVRSDKKFLPAHPNFWLDCLADAEEEEKFRKNVMFETHSLLKKNN